MARFDIYTDTLPVNQLRPIRTPQISSLRTALNGYNATSYSAARLDDMTENDMIYAARTHGLSVINPT